MYADTDLGRVEASPGLTGTCPSCGHPCRPKCGQINVHHWAHHARADCDPWSEPESDWHRKWKLAVPAARREVVIGEHRADVVTASGGVVELQHSAISPAVIEEREQFYGDRMAWIFDVSEAFTAGRLTFEAFENVKVQSDFFRWKHPRRSVGACKRTVLLDLGNDLVLHVTTPRDPRWDFELDSGWCRLLTRDSVEGWLRDGASWEVRRVPAAPEPEPRRCGCGEVHA